MHSELRNNFLAGDGFSCLGARRGSSVSCAHDYRLKFGEGRAGPVRAQVVITFKFDIDDATYHCTQDFRIGTIGSRELAARWSDLMASIVLTILFRHTIKLSL